MEAVALSDLQWLSWVNPYLPMAFTPTADFHRLVRGNPAHFDLAGERAIQQELLVGNTHNEGSFFLFYQYFARFFGADGFFAEKDGQRLVFDNAFVRQRLETSVRTKTFREEDLTREARAEEDAWYARFIHCLDDVYSINGRWRWLLDSFECVGGRTCIARF
jgi:hypothetical protein